MILKARAWDTKNKCFHYSDSFEKLSKFFQFCEELSLTTEVVFHLSTGEQDIKGTDIYVGDVLYERYEDKMEPRGYGEVRLEITFQDGSFGWIGDITGEFTSFAIDPLGDMEIIGNVCANPNILINIEDEEEKEPEQQGLVDTEHLSLEINTKRISQRLLYRGISFKKRKKSNNG